MDFLILDINVRVYGLLELENEKCSLLFEGGKKKLFIALDSDSIFKFEHNVKKVFLFLFHTNEHLVFLLKKEYTTFFLISFYIYSLHITMLQYFIFILEV